MTNLEQYQYDHPSVYRLLVLAACVVISFFFPMPLLTSESDADIIFAPLAFFAPVISLYLGWPAIIGSSIGNGLSYFIQGTGSTVGFFESLGISFVCLVLPYLLWYLLFMKAKRPYPRLESATKMGVYIALFLIDAILATFASMWIDIAAGALSPDNGEDMVLAFITYVSNYLLFPMFLGVPLLVLLDRSPLIPLPPPWIKVPYERRKMSLTQKNMLMLITGSIFVVIIFNLVAYSFDLAEAFASAQSGDTTLLVETVWSMLLWSVILFLMVLILGAFAMRYIEIHLARPIERVARASSEFVEQMAEYRESSDKNKLAIEDINISGVKPAGEIADLVENTNRMRHDLVEYVDKLAQSTANSERIATELAVARSIQLSAVPHDFSSWRTRFRLDISATLRPAREVGGDFYDVFDVGPHSIGIIIADVSGKGMPAALFMMRALAETREQMRYRGNVGEALTITNRALCEKNDAMLFVTMFAAVLDAETGRVTYANAGHNPTWYSSQESRWLKAPPGLVMGVMDTVDYETQTLAMRPGDALFFYTDGVTEAINEDKELFSNKRLEETLRSLRSIRMKGDQITAEDVVDTVLKAVDDFAGDEPQFDDITAMSIIWDVPVHTIELAPNDAALPELFEFIEPFCTGEGRTKRMAFETQLVLEELFVNIAHYGFPEGQPEQPVSVQIAVDEAKQMLYITLSDAGIPYDPLSYESQKVEPGVEHRIGGLGILLVREMVNDIYYERANELNIVHIAKSFV